MEHTYIIPVSNVCCKGPRPNMLEMEWKCTSAHHLVIQDLVQNLVYLVQLHHCTMAPYAYASDSTNNIFSAGTAGSIV